MGFKTFTEKELAEMEENCLAIIRYTENNLYIQIKAKNLLKKIRK